MNKPETPANKIPAGQPLWMRGTASSTAVSTPAGGAPTVAVPRGLVVAGGVAAVLCALILAFVLGAVGASNAPTTGGTENVSYGAPTNPQDGQHGPLRQPNAAEMNAYGQALETTYGTCSLEWHGDQGGWWEPVCKGPNSK